MTSSPVFCVCGVLDGRFTVDPRMTWRHMSFCPHSSAETKETSVVKLTNDQERAEWLQCLQAAAATIGAIHVVDFPDADAVTRATYEIAERFFRDYQERSK